MEALTNELFATLPMTEQIARLDQVDARTRQNLILSSRNSLALARSLSSEKLFYTLKEIGLTDAVDLLALASPEQVRDMMDLDCWRKDALDDRRMLTWLLMLDEAGSGKLAEWALHVDVELLVLLVKRHFEVVRKAEVEEDPDFNQAKYFTFDDQYLLRFIGEEEPILALLLERLRVLDYETYRHILEWSLLEFDSALEEDSLRWRNARLADRGYPSYDEAQELFRFMAPESLSLARYRRASVAKVHYTAGEELTPADHALMLLDVQSSLLVRVLARLSSEQREQAGHELAILSNEVVIAEACDAGELAEVRKCVEEVHDYVNIGLAHLAADNEEQAARLLDETLLRPFFQAGLSLTLQLQYRARELDRLLRRQIGEHWESFLDSPFRETCTNVRRHPPVFFRGLETPGEIFSRRFRTLSEVKQVETVLSQIPVWFEVFHRGQLLPERPAADGETLAVLWNTAFARWSIDGQVTAQPLTREEFLACQRRLATTAQAEAQARFVALCAARLLLTAEEQDALQGLAAFAWDRLEEVFAVDANKADLRFIEGVLVAE
jgi:hypothetical protein